ncbi:flagellar biosynthesis protein FlhA [Limnobacter sp.]|uniref:flagellar biosynthesis protein FlhA n=1 Tax=Limnobacter sp. TaxID=2003368 RepID=UPI002588F496|nr:flagellar biosynthesis protein FlhA [Limnobacter sp.]
MIAVLNKFARLASARSEVVGASLVLLMITMMVVPLQPALLDVLIAVNISAAILLVISAVLLESPLSFSSFPAILLMTTLFRLSLTISTTRQILLEADAGHIVQTFGEFVVGGNVAVGLVIFLIISVVNFLVVTKGSERVAEVAARFSLDGMPGKQMSIDSDLRAGLINQTMAKKRRSDLEKESQLFGAMDGAIKFVKNDAIAGLVITVVNLLGGLTVGMLQKDMSFSKAGAVYTILSVGDGLVGIIPSLMISIAAGLIVTRVTKGEADGSNAAQDMLRDLGRNSYALQISGIFCILFSFVPGMPRLVFLAAAVALFTAWFFMSKVKDVTPSVDVASQFSDMLNLENNVQMDDVYIGSYLVVASSPEELTQLLNYLSAICKRPVDELRASGVLSKCPSCILARITLRARSCGSLLIWLNRASIFLPISSSGVLTCRTNAVSSCEASLRLASISACSSAWPMQLA